MKANVAIGIAIASISVIGLTACSSDTATDTPSAPAVEAPAQTPAESAAGTIVVDGNGLAVYQFDSDTQGSGESSCSGGCLTTWPAVPGGDAAPELDGVTGTVETITGTDGNPQLTLNGWPLYYYVSDSAAGDINGQGVGGVWWVVTPAGEPIVN
jgi:predicted lipoprotein with Yx(FWY)xxD motif